MTESGANLSISLLPPQPSRRRPFAASFLMQTGLVAISLALATRASMPMPVHPTHHYIALVGPEAYHNTPRINRPRLQTVPQPDSPMPREQLITPGPVAPEPPAPSIRAAATRPPHPIMDAPKPVLRPVHTGVFGSSAVPTIADRPLSSVQTGGFGDISGLPAASNGHGIRNVNALGSFELPAGPGHGNGIARGRGIPGVVASVGFGNGIAQAHSAPQATVQPTAFGSITAAQPQPSKQTTAPTPKITPVAIQSKPVPAYTPEAKALHIEGEVLLQVIFTSQGQVRVVRVLKGLGHGLDEAAIRAVESIHFSPAQQGNEFIDWPATLHVVFELSS